MIQLQRSAEQRKPTAQSDLISNGSSIGTATTDGSGNFSVTPSSDLADDGSYSLTVTATDAAGNVSATSGTVSITVDETAPAQPTISTGTTTTSERLQRSAEQRKPTAQSI